MNIYIISFCLVFGMGTLKASESSAVLSLDVFSIRVPKNTKCEKKLKVDFTIYTFSNNKGVFLNIYTGSNPDFPSLTSEKVDFSFVKINGVRVKMAAHRTEGQLRSNEYLFFNVDNGEKVPILHAWFNSLHGKQLSLAEEAIRTIVVTGK